MGKKFYLATAIVYSSKPPHIGNDYEIVLSDCIARFKRMSGYDVLFSTGTDEHGQKVEENAAAEGITPQEYVDRITGMICDTYKRMNISYDRFIRTTDAQHKEAVKRIFVKLYENGDIYKGIYEGLYCVPCESFYTGSQVKDTGGNCPDCGRGLREEKEDAYFLRLSKYQQQLEQYIEAHPGWLAPEQRKREILNNFIKPGLQDLCVSRTSVKWGVPVEFDPGHIIYVWIDALSNYITLLGYHPDCAEPGELFNKYWPCDLHVIGKDIMRFHAVYWPVILWGLGLEQPGKILGHQWLLVGDEKMSKSTGNVIYTGDVIDRFGVDAFRYYMLSEMNFERDGSFTYSNFIKIYNSILANTLGNLVSRTVAMTGKYFGGVTPEPAERADIDEDLRGFIAAEAGDYAALMDEYKTADAIGRVVNILYRANKYIDETEPWVLAKSEQNKARLGTVLYNLLESIRIAAVLLSPVMPETCGKIFAQINSGARGYESAFAFGGLESGVRLGKSEILFARLDEERVLAEIKAAQSSSPAEAKSSDTQISIDDFAKVELKVAQVLECEKVEKSDKLLKLQVDAGDGRRQIVSGIAEFYAPADLVGKKIVLVSNLKPAKVRGVESRGMLLAASEFVDGKENVCVVFADDGAAVGSRVK